MNRRASRILTVCAGAWLLVIWGQSCMPAVHSGAESGALLTLVQAFLPHMTDHILRKCAHFGEYALLGVLTAAALRTEKSVESAAPPVSTPSVLTTISLADTPDRIATPAFQFRPSGSTAGSHQRPNCPR